MARRVIIDELHLTIRVSNDLPELQTDTIHQTLTSDDFMNRLRQAVRVVISGYPNLAVVRMSLTR